LLVLQKVNQFPESTVIASVGNSHVKGRSHPAAQATARLIAFGSEGIGTHQALATNGTDPTCDRTHGRQAIFTNWQAGNFDQRGTAETTIGREQGGEQAFDSAAHPRDQESLLACWTGLRVPDLVLATAEDRPPCPINRTIDISV